MPLFSSVFFQSAPYHHCCKLKSRFDHWANLFRLVANEKRALVEGNFRTKIREEKLNWHNLSSAEEKIVTFFSLQDVCNDLLQFTRELVLFPTWVILLHKVDNFMKSMKKRKKDKGKFFSIELLTPLGHNLAFLFRVRRRRSTLPEAVPFVRRDRPAGPSWMETLPVAMTAPILNFLFLRRILSCFHDFVGMNGERSMASSPKKVRGKGKKEWTIGNNRDLPCDVENGVCLVLGKSFLFNESVCSWRRWLMMVENNYVISCCC